MLEEFREKLQKDLQLEEPLGVAGQENFSLLYDDIPIQVETLPPGFYLHATLGFLPKEEQELLFVKLLQANLFFQATNGSILALDDSGSKIVLHYHYPTKASYTEFKDVFEDFFNIIDFWKGQIHEHIQNPLTNL